MPFFLTLTLPKAWFVARRHRYSPTTRDTKRRRFAKFACVVVTALLGPLLSTKAIGQTVLTFDNVTDQAAIPNGYGGLDWTNMFGEHWDTNLDSGTGFENGSVGPGTGVVFNGNGTQGTVVSSPTKFDFNGAYLTGAWNDGLKVTVTAFLNSVQVDSQTVTTSFSTPTFFTFNFDNIDALKFTSSGGIQSPNADGSGTEFVMDNFTFTPLALRGDVNLDNRVNDLDITALESALTDLTGYANQNKVTPQQILALGDVNQDGALTNADLQSLILQLKAGNSSADPTPEPATLALLALGSLGLLARRRLTTK